MKKSIIVLLLALFLIACNNTPKDEVMTSEDAILNDDNIMISTKTQEPYTGTITKYHENGKIQGVLSYREGLRHGESKAFYESGQILISMNLKDGVVHGDLIRYHENGKIAGASHYIDGKVHGKTQDYYEDGQPERIMTSENGELHGDFIEYYPNGNISLKAVYEHNRINGDATMYYEDGRIKQIEHYIFGALMKTETFE